MRSGVVGLVVGVAQHAAGQVAGVLAFLHQHLAVDEGRVDALRRLLDALSRRSGSRARTSSGSGFTVSGSKITMSATMPGRSRPRS